MDEGMLNVNWAYTGGSFDNNEIDLYPFAFVDEESLARTLFHEDYHQRQYKKFGYENVKDDYIEYERITREAEKLWWDNKEWVK